MSCFLSGLMDEIRLLVRMFNPINLGTTFGLALIQEEFILSSKKPRKYFSMEKKLVESGSDNNVRNNREVIIPKRISSSQIDKMRKKDIFFHCDEKWGPGHICKKPRVYLLQEDECVSHKQEQEVEFDSQKDE